MKTTLLIFSLLCSYALADWHPIKLSADLPKVANAFIHRHKDSLFVFGGCNQQLDCSSVMYRITGDKINPLADLHNEPIAREGASYLIRGHELWLIGGRDVNAGYSSIFYSFNFDTLSWSEHIFTGMVGVKNHKVVLHNSGKAYVFGGFNV